MVEFKIQLEESLVESMGYKQIENYLQDFVQKALIKMAAKDILNDLANDEIENDSEWRLARNLAWKQEKSRYIS